MSQTNIKSPSNSPHGSKHSVHSSTVKSTPKGSKISVKSKSSKSLKKSSASVTGSEKPVKFQEHSKTSLKEEFIKETFPGKYEEQAGESEEEKLITHLDLIGPPKKLSLDEFLIRNLDKEELFPKVVTLDSDDTLVETNKEVPSILVSGFGMRNLKSLQDALEEENKKILELYKRQQEIEDSKRKVSKASTSSSSSLKSQSISKVSSTTSTEKSSAMSDKFKLQYLLGLETCEEEFEEAKEEKESEEKISFTYSSSTSMKKAQQYLRLHRIFDFFQFIIAHLLAAAPDNPVNFILELLNKCLLYRSGAGPPPLLYETKHISQLYNLMDRMGTGFIDSEQYVQGMKTLGICEYNKEPVQTKEGISTETFMEEVYEAELSLFDDLIRRKYMNKKSRKDKPINYKIETKESTTSYFMPADLFQSLKPRKLSLIKEDTETEHEG